GQVLIEAYEYVLDLPTPWAKRVPDIVGRGIADPEIVGRAAAPQTQRIDGRFRQFGEVGVGKRTRRPLGVERFVRPSASFATPQRERKARSPSRDRVRSEWVFVVPIPIARQRKSPSFAVIGSHGVLLHVVFNEGHRPVGG